MNISSILALIIVALAVWYLWRRFTRKGGGVCDCPGCACSEDSPACGQSGCSCQSCADEEQGPPLGKD